MNEIMRAEILDQPEALHQSLPQLRQQLTSFSASLAQNRALVLTGSGDSYFAPLGLSYAARLAGLNHVHVLTALEAAEYWPFSPQDLLVPISVSGRAAQTLHAAKAARAQNASVLAVTANDTSPLASLAGNFLRLPFRSRSRQTPHTTDYSATLLALAALFEHLTRGRIDILDRLPGLVSETISAAENHCEQISITLKDKENFFFIGGGPGYATGLYAAAKFWEAGGLRASAFDLEELAHGPHFLMDPGDPVFVIAQSGKILPRAKEIVAGLQDLRARIYVVTDRVDEFPDLPCIAVPELPEEWSPFVTSIPFQWLCLFVANVKGYDVLKKDGRHINPAAYEIAHRRWVSFSPEKL